MKHIILITLFATGALLGTGQAYGQKVYKDTDGKVILDCSAESKMQQKAVTTEKKYTATTVASNTKFILGTVEASTAANAKIYYKLEIAPQDMQIDGTLGPLGPTTDAILWDVAYNNCKNLNHNGTGWRLPTQRELQMMYLFRTAINSLLSDSFGESSYKCATELKAADGFFVSFKDGSSQANSKTFTTAPIRARCVREL